MYIFKIVNLTYMDTMIVGFILYSEIISKSWRRESNNQGLLRGFTNRKPKTKVRTEFIVSN